MESGPKLVSKVRRWAGRSEVPSRAPCTSVALRPSYPDVPSSPVYIPGDRDPPSRNFVIHVLETQVCRTEVEVEGVNSRQTEPLGTGVKEDTSLGSLRMGSSNSTLRCSRVSYGTHVPPVPVYRPARRTRGTENPSSLTSGPNPTVPTWKRRLPFDKRTPTLRQGFDVRGPPSPSS